MTQNTIPLSTLRPGLLVSLRSKIQGNVRYTRRDVGFDRVEGTEIEKKTWETERTIMDAKEFDAARKARAESTYCIRKVCTFSEFGLLCPESDKDKLDEAVAKARAVADTFNATAYQTRLTVNVIAGRIAPDDVEAVRAINSEVRDLLDAMKAGVEKLDVTAIRAAAAQAKDMGQMLNDEARERIQSAVEAGRKAARVIVKAGEQAAAEIDSSFVKAITDSRVAFLDLDANGYARVETPEADARAVDFEASEPIVPTKMQAASIDLE